jgi:6-pyruvoyl-tetrahydropterin synthase
MFRASHSLSGYEKPHFHYWTLSFAVGGKIQNGMIVDLVLLRGKTQCLISPLEGQYLNECFALSLPAQKTPTCETLSAHFATAISALLKSELAPANPTVHLAWVSISIHEEDKTEMGAVKLKIDR